MKTAWWPLPGLPRSVVQSFLNLSTGLGSTCTPPAAAMAYKKTYHKRNPCAYKPLWAPGLGHANVQGGSEDKGYTPISALSVTSQKTLNMDQWATWNIE